MKLATLKTGGRDGTPVLVSRDMKKMVLATSVALTLRDAIENWTSVEPDLQNLANKLEAEEVETIVYDPKTLASPLPRAFQWADGSAYVALKCRQTLRQIQCFIKVAVMDF
jgi:fumarylacetoacetate (FAA) hydrolase